ncbi:MAG: hypothetical protein LHW60_01945 [Candidatus Cloacimonetes bacterium]|nr:hypothetical protein [Candidatus Cloacimonadota bacterium]
MGTQQILLIVLSVIIVGAAIAVGIQMFNNQAYSSNKSAIAAEAQTYATQIVQFYKTPVSQGGLGGKLVEADGLTKEKAIELIQNYLGWGTDAHESESGEFTIEDATATTVVVKGKGSAVRNNLSPHVETTVTFPEGTISAVLTDE